MPRRNFLPAFLTVGLLVLLGGCVMPEQLSQLQKDVADIQQELKVIQQEQAATQEQLEEMASELSEGDGIKRSDFADLRLQVEDISRNVAILDEQVNDANRRLDRFSQNVEEVRELARRPAAVPGGTEQAPSGGLPPGEEPGDPFAGPGTPQGPRAEPLPSPEALYNAAYADFAKGNYALAISGFEEYSTRFADSELADNALYWIGECYFSQGNFAEALEALDGLLQRYPNSDRAAAANLKKGLAYLEQNQVRRAIVQLKYVVEEYPGSDESRIARDKLASLGA